VSKSIILLCHHTHRHRLVDDAEECRVCNLVAAVCCRQLALLLLLLLWVAGSAQGCEGGCHGVVLMCFERQSGTLEQSATLENCANTHTVTEQHLTSFSTL
jgi:hypothetical protein